MYCCYQVHHAIVAATPPPAVLPIADQRRGDKQGRWYTRIIIGPEKKTPRRNRCPPPLQVVLQPKREALQEAKRNRDGVILWTDGSRLDIGKAGTAIVWFEKSLDKWQEKKQYLGGK